MVQGLTLLAVVDIYLLPGSDWKKIDESFLGMLCCSVNNFLYLTCGTS